jgi:hypothetical protein
MRFSNYALVGRICSRSARRAVRGGLRYGDGCKTRNWESVGVLTRFFIRIFRLEE